MYLDIDDNLPVVKLYVRLKPVLVTKPSERKYICRRLHLDIVKMAGNCKPQ